MGSRLSAPGPQEKRFAAYIEGLAKAAGHADRHTPLKNYCKGLLLPGERKSVEPMAAAWLPSNVRRMHQSLHHLVADAPWNDEEMLAEVRQHVLANACRNKVQWWRGLWMIRAFPSKASIPWESPGSTAARSANRITAGGGEFVGEHLEFESADCLAVVPAGSVGRGCRAAAKSGSSRSRLKFQTKPEIALEQIRQAMEQRSRREWYWQMRVMGTTLSSARPYATRTAICRGHSEFD